MFKNPAVFYLAVWLTSIIVTSTILAAKAVEIYRPWDSGLAAAFSPETLEMVVDNNTKFDSEPLVITFMHPVSNLTLSVEGNTTGFDDIVHINNSTITKEPIIEPGRYPISVTSDLRDVLLFSNKTYQGNITAVYINNDSKQEETILARINLTLSPTNPEPKPVGTSHPVTYVPVKFKLELGYKNDTNSSIGNVTYKVKFNSTDGNILIDNVTNRTFSNYTKLDNSTVLFNATGIMRNQNKSADITLNLPNHSIEKDVLPAAHVDVTINGTTQSSTIQLPPLERLLSSEAISDEFASSIPLTSIIDKAEKVVGVVKEGVEVGEKGFNLISGIYNMTVSCLNIEVNNTSSSNPRNPTFDVEMENCSAHPELINSTITDLTPGVSVTDNTCNSREFELGSKDKSQCKIGVLIPHDISNVSFVIRGDILLKEIGSKDSRTQEVIYSPSSPPPVSPTHLIRPLANAGPDQIVDENTKNVTLYGINSLDFDGYITHHKWEYMGSSNHSVEWSGKNNTNTNTANLKFDAPNVTSDTLLTFELIVKDNKNSSDSDIANVLIKVNQTQAEGNNSMIETNGSGNNKSSVKVEPPSIHMVFAIDSSRSMNDNDPEQLRLALTTDFTNRLNRSRDTAALISWDKNIDSFFGLTSNFTTLKNKINEVDSEGGTNLDVGLEAAMNVLDVVSNDNSYKTIILLSDGHGEYTPSDDPSSLVNAARNKGYTIFPIGLNVEPLSDDENTLKNIANATGGKYFLLSPGGFSNIVNSIFQQITESFYNLRSN